MLLFRSEQSANSHTPPSFLEGSPSEKEQLARAMRELDRPHCRFFITSVCRYGAKCRFAHVVTRLNLSHDLRTSIRKMVDIDQSGFEKVAPMEWRDFYRMAT